MMHAGITVRVTAPLVLAGALASCTVGPDYHEPATDAPATWTEPASAPGPLDTHWWKAFGDPELDRLVTLAAASNTDLRIAEAHLREARAQRGVASGVLFPEIDASGSFSNSRLSENGFLKGIATGGAPGSGGTPGAIVPGQQINLWQVGLDMSWEIDLFGGQRRAVEAADADIGAAEYELRDALVAVIAEVADEYVQVRTAQERLDIAEETARSERATADVVEEQLRSGVASELDRARASSQAENAAARVPQMEANVRAGVRRLEVLVGAKPGTLDAELKKPAPVPTPPDALAVGIPSEMLRRRPDVRAAERRLAAATARIGVATADLFPRFSLTGSFGLQSQDLGDLPEGDSRFWYIGPSVRWPLLDFGRIRSNIAVQNARTQAAEATYEGVILRSLSEVETALVRLSRERRRLEHLDAAATDARRAASVANELYRNGLLEYLDLLDAQRTAYEAEDALAQSRAAIAGDTVRLYRALGGGWEGEEAQASAAD